MAVTGLEGLALLVGRVLFGGVIAFTGLNHFMQTEQMTGYARHKGVPAPKLGVLASGLFLILGGFSVMLGVFPSLGAVAIAGFLIVAAVMFHDFWAVPEDQQQTEMTQFLKNICLAGGALVIAAVGSQEWVYSLNVMLF
ncbi:DoxX family membrane protein [Natronorubrum halophilum]|uniref:DoxX family membrane protein n=1 Tax=Natronorubrum halophilum TaxID=1702106 RepID=UPI000EF6B561